MEKMKSQSIRVSKARRRPLLVQDGVAYFSQGYTLFAEHKSGEVQRIASFAPGMLADLRSLLPYLPKLFRDGFHDLCLLEDGSMVAVVRKHIIYRAPGEASFRSVLPIERGSRPLGLCLYPDGSIYFGEYFSNGKPFQTNPELANAEKLIRRDPVRIYGSSDGIDWRVVYTFPRDTIRHVHGIFHDPYRDCAWILTGDFGREAGIWVTYDQFATVEPFLVGSQAFRAAWMFVLRERLLFPMDSNLEQNYMQALDPYTKKLTRISPLPGPAISGAQGSHFVVSTMVDYSEVDQSENVCVLASKSGDDWKIVAEFERVWDPLSHPRVQFAKQKRDSRVHSYGINVRGHDENMQIWDL